MAAESVRLAEAHRLAQARIGNETVRLMGQMFPLLALSNLDAAATRWLRTAVPVVQAQSIRSARLAADYLTVARRLDLGDDPVWAPVVARPNPAQIASSLSVTGPLRARQLIAKGAGPAVVRRTVLTTSSRSGMRLALAGGRDTIIGTVVPDRRARWARVTSGRPCAFCAMLASRGPVYRGPSAGFQAHDGCACSAMAVFDPRVDGWTSQAAEFRGLWEEATAGESGRDALNAFRRALEGAGADLAAAA